MIANQRQYKITLAQIAKFVAALKDLETSEKAREMHPKRRKMYEGAFQSQIDEMREEAEAFERLTNHGDEPHEVGSLAGLAEGLIKARIAAGLTQKQLAERLGIKEQQVQRYEASSYRAASLERVREVMEALGIDVEGRLVRKAA